MARERKSSRKFQGTRNHGKGNTKNRRGKGNKGGWGRAGMHKHRFTYITTYEPDFFGVHGFASVKKRRMKTINIYEIGQLALSGKLEKKEGRDYFEFQGKVLGTGSISKPVAVKAMAFSEGAEGKIKAAGGSVERFAGPAPKAEEEK